MISAKNDVPHYRKTSSEISLNFRSYNFGRCFVAGEWAMGKNRIVEIEKSQCKIKRHDFTYGAKSTCRDVGA